MTAQQLFDIHRQQVAIQHGGGFDVLFRQRLRGQLKRKPTRLQHTALHIFNTLFEMAMAGVDIRPSINNADHWLTGPVFGAIAHLHGTRTMAKRAQIIGGKPACTAQRLGSFDFWIFDFSGHARVSGIKLLGCLAA